VVFIGKAQEKCTIYRTEKRRNPKTKRTYPWIVKSTVLVNHYYFYRIDEDFGPFFLKFCSHFPYNAKLWLNGHKYLKQQLEQKGIAYQALENGILSCEDPQALQGLCDRLSEDMIDALLRKWLQRLPHPFAPGVGTVTGPSSVKPAMTKDGQIKSGCTTPRALPSNDTSRSKAKLTRTIQPMKPTSKNVKRLTCWKRFGVLVLFAISGMNNVDSARCAIQKSPGSRAGAFITASPVRWGVQQVLRTAFYFIPSAMTGFIVNVFPFRNRVSSKEAFEGLELGEGKPSRPVLRGPGGRKAAWLLGSFTG
jgi:hypothetical protein